MNKRQFEDFRIELKKLAPIVLNAGLIDLGLKKGNLDYKRFIILGRSRTGSNFLRGLLNSHPDILCYGERFRHYDHNDNVGKVNALKELDTKLFRKYGNSLKAVGFKLFYYHSHKDENDMLWERLISDKDLHVIHITRSNMFKTIVSRKKADFTDKWANRGNSKEMKMEFEIPYEECVKEFDWTQDLETKYREIFKDHKVHEIVYEDLESDIDNTMRKVLEFLDIRYLPLTPSTYKQRKETMKQTVLNYDELKEKFKSTKWSEFFEE